MTIDLEDEETLIAEDQLEAARRDPATFVRMGDLISDMSTPFAARFRALFTLKNLKGPLAVDAISRGFVEPSPLFRHELAYVLGQLQDEAALPVLSTILDDATEDAMVRHEAGEALGAIGSEASLELLRKHAASEIVVLAETCQIAVDRIVHEAGKRTGSVVEGEIFNPYHTIDPAPAIEGGTPAVIFSRSARCHRLSSFSLSLFALAPPVIFVALRVGTAFLSIFAQPLL